MIFSRRHFLGGVTGCAATLCAFQPVGLELPGNPRVISRVLLDLHTHCVLRESLQGYQAALRGEHSLVRETDLDLQRGCRMVVVPALGLMDTAVACAISDLLAAGTHVLLESGAGFLRPAEFTAHQSMLHRYFAIELGSPVELWAAQSMESAVRSHRFGRLTSMRRNRYPADPYVSYLWPRAAKVRDFGRAIPVSTSGAETVGTIGSVPVALKKRAAKGTLIFLGSPLGPALRAGDLEALTWLQSVTTTL